MPKPIDYSKWGHIDISDDEDNQHPNIDKESLWRWEKQSRYERYAKEEKEKEEVISKRQQAQAKLMQAKQAGDEEHAKEYESQYKEYADKEAHIKKMEKIHPKWNSSNMCKDGFSKSIVNKKAMKADKDKTEEEIQKEQNEFFKKHKHEIRKFGRLPNREAAKEYLLEHPEIFNEYSANYLVVWCVDLEVEEKHEDVELVAKQTVLMQHLLEILKTKKDSPMNIIRTFFQRTAEAGDQYDIAYKEEWTALIERVKDRAKEREKEAIEEYEREEKEKRIAASPGGLDPNEVMESLPECMQKAFTERDIPMLQEAIKTLTVEDAKYHIDRCVKSGLWVAGPDDDEDGVEGDVEEEEEYEEMD